MHKKIFLLPLLLLLSCNALWAQLFVITVQNKSALPFTDQLIEVPWQPLQQMLSADGNHSFKIINATTKQELAWQLEYIGQTTIQNLLVQVSVPANASLKLWGIKGIPKKIAAKTDCRYVPQRKDDFAWENDKIAFRMYGKALQGTNEDAYGIDVWVKRTHSLLLAERYKKNDYHIDHGNGLDYYHVGHTLGAGNIAPFVEDSIWYPGNYTEYKILDNGPLRSTFELRYVPWNVNGKMVSVIKIISLDAGSQLNFVKANYQLQGGATFFPVVVGIIKRNEPGSIFFNEGKGIIGYWEPEDKKNGTTGVGIVVASGKNMLLQKSQILLQASLDGGAINYYTGAAWSKAKEVANSESWFRYLQQFQQKKSTPLIVKLQKGSSR